MIRKEGGKQIPVSEPASPFILSTGRWDENISWEFIVAPEKPERKLCTAVCCIATFNRKLLLVRNKGCWEFPSGIIESGETGEEAAIRETGEETGAVINNPQFFGYRKLTVQQPVERPEKQGTYYPFPYSYVLYFYTDASEIFQRTPAEEIEETKVARYDEARNLLTPGGQYKTILDYLIGNELIDVI